MKNYFLLLLLMSNFAIAQVGINTSNPQGVFHIDGAKDNPVTGIPTTVQQGNDVVVSNTGNMGIATINPATNLQIGSGLVNGLETPTIRLTSSLNAFAGGGVLQFLENNQQYGLIVRHHAGNNATTEREGLYFNGLALNVESTVPIMMLDQVNARVGVGTAIPASSLDITAKNPTGTATTVDGLLVPRIDRQRAQSMAGVPGSTLVYINDISTGTAAGTTIDVTAVGYYYFDGTKWTAILSSANNNNWQLTGNAGTDPAINFIGTSDNQNVIFKRNNIQAGFLSPGNTAFGLASLSPTSTALFSTAFGVNALGNSTGNLGSAFGYQALAANTTGSNNSAFGTQALGVNTTGVSNTALGSLALGDMVSGGSNTAVGHLALRNATGSFNTSMGYASLNDLTTGTSNIGIGQNAGNEGTGGVNFTSGDGNIIIGRQAALPNGNNQMNIGSVLFGTSINGTLAARTGNIGIKTPNPQQTFHIDGAADNPVTGAPTATQQVNDVVVTTSGNVGVGTINPLNKLHVDALTSNLGRFTLIDAPEGTAQTPILALRNTSPTATGNYSLLGFTNSGTTSGGANWGIGSIRTATNEDFFMGNSLGGSYIERFRITSTGNVGIGTTAPASLLDVNGEISISNGTLRWGINTSSGGSTGSTSALEIVDRVNNVRRMVFNNNGNIYIGGPLVNNTGANTPAIAVNNNAGTYNIGMGTASPTQKLHVIGNILASGTITPSDIRIKKEITDNSYGLKEIINLKTINYKYKDEELSKDKKVGFIAQEIKATMPELVTTANDEMKTLGVNYAEMTVVLTKAIQEQQIQINNLKKEIEELKKK
jgi:hypothetical protein